MFDYMPQLLIPMEMDNDCESEWGDISHNINNMAMSLSMAAYDNIYH